MNAQIVTIGIPAYNEGRYLSETIQTALNQTYKHIRVLVSDNGSTDDTYQIASKFSEKDNRVSVYRQEKNIGVIENFIFVRDKCETKYFMWLGSHDLMDNKFVEKGVNYLEKNSEAVLYYPKARYFEHIETLLENSDSEIESQDALPVNRMMKVVKMLASCTAIHGVFKADVIKKIPFEKVGADNLVLFLLAAYGFIATSNETDYFRRVVRKETQEEFVARMKKYGMGKADTMLQYRVEVYQVHFKYIFNNEMLSFSEKMELFFRLRDLCVYRYPQEFTRIALLKYFLTKSVDLPVALMLPVAYLFELPQLLKRKFGK